MSDGGVSKTQTSKTQTADRRPQTADLENADLENADLENADLENVDLKNGKTKIQNVPKKSLGSGKEAMSYYFRRVTCFTYPERECIYDLSSPYTNLTELTMNCLTEFCYGLLVFRHIRSNGRK